MARETLTTVLAGVLVVAIKKGFTLSVYLALYHQQCRVRRGDLER